MASASSSEAGAIVGGEISFRRQSGHETRCRCSSSVSIKSSCISCMSRCNVTWESSGIGVSFTTHPASKIVGLLSGYLLGDRRQRARAAFFADAERCDCVRFFARACPPRRPNAAAASLICNFLFTLAYRYAWPVYASSTPVAIYIRDMYIEMHAGRVLRVGRREGYGQRASP